MADLRSWKCWLALVWLVAFALLSSGEGNQQTESIATSRSTLPILPSSPILDGRVIEPLWQQASTFDLDDESTLQVRAGIDSTGIWFALKGKNVPRTACIIFTFRVTDEFENADEFTLSADGSKKFRRLRTTPLPHQGDWEAKVARTGTEWSAEVFIPFATLGLKEVKQGDAVLLDLQWQEGKEKWGKQFHCYFGRMNLLSSPDLSDKSRWSFSGNDAQLYESVIEEGRRVIRLKSPGRYSTMSQSLQLHPNAV